MACRGRHDKGTGVGCDVMACALAILTAAARGGEPATVTVIWYRIVHAQGKVFSGGIQI